MQKLKNGLRSFGLARIIIIAFLIVILITAAVQGQNMGTLFSDSLVRIFMNLPLSLAMIPAMNSGIGMNMGLPIGILGGLMGGIISIELGVSSWAGFLIAIALGILISSVLGLIYGKMLNVVRGSEMLIGNYLAMSMIYVFCIFWFLVPFKSGLVIKPMMGYGVRNTVALTSVYDKILNSFGTFTLFGVTFPTGMILFDALLCVLIAVFVRTKTGHSLTASGDNPDFAAGAGINVNRMKILGALLSTVLGGIGIIVYSQSYGFYQAYEAPLNMAFAPMAGVLLGGATLKKATIWNAILGTAIFQTMLTCAVPVCNQLLAGIDISEIIRIIVCNGIILYALTQAGGDKQ